MRAVGSDPQAGGVPETSTLWPWRGSQSECVQERLRGRRDSKLRTRIELEALQQLPGKGLKFPTQCSLSRDDAFTASVATDPMKSRIAGLGPRVRRGLPFRPPQIRIHPPRSPTQPSSPGSKANRDAQEGDFWEAKVLSRGFNRPVGIEVVPGWQETQEKSPDFTGWVSLKREHLTEIYGAWGLASPVPHWIPEPEPAGDGTEPWDETVIGGLPQDEPDPESDRRPITAG